jgi:hypothetical protein
VFSEKNIEKYLDKIIKAKEGKSNDYKKKTVYKMKEIS